MNATAPCDVRALAVSVVIPTISTPSRVSGALPPLLTALLASPTLRHPSSEILLNHGTRASYEARGELRGAVTRKLGARAAWPRYCGLRQLRHIHGPRAELFAASRFFASTSRRLLGCTSIRENSESSFNESERRCPAQREPSLGAR